MPTTSFKTVGILRAGFEYQDLVAIEVLIDFYRDRGRYDWVQLESEDRRFRSVDDVVAARPDGRFELYQVKFTPNPADPANEISLDWLTSKSPRGRSLLNKWSDSVLTQKEAGKLERGVLKTDRRPDATIAACLEDNRLRYDRLSPTDKAIVDAEIGSSERAASFFEAFVFEHSKLHIDDLEDQLFSRIAFDIDQAGWFQFRQQVQIWSTRRNSPTPDGRIRHVHLQQAFSASRPKPIPQNFLVPDNYCVPDVEFDDAFIERLTNTFDTTVLWAPPGRGKSTYLSYCVERLTSKVALCIRHHYFLSLDEQSTTRFHFHSIKHSLENQIASALPTLATGSADLRDTISRAAQVLKSEGRRLIVIIDGLDHVWRENRSQEHMEQVFNELLPLPDNVHLVVGTQKIQQQSLPAKLLSTKPMGAWTELPLMSRTAVGDWLTFQFKAGRINFDDSIGDRSCSWLAEVADAFFNISRGLPLHLIYSFEATVRTGEPLRVQQIEQLPPCPTGDIRDYYRSLWTRISVRGQAILHSLAGLSFGPPLSAFPDCFGRDEASFEGRAEIDHLLDWRETGVRPFHESIFAFVKDFPDHEQQFQSMLGPVLAWLENVAPPYWRWAWLWVTQAAGGNSSPLLNGPTRAWAISALLTGYPIGQLANILDDAERYAFANFDLSRFIQLRSLKIRALNGPEFQTDVWPLFSEVAIALSEDRTPFALLRADLARAPAQLFPFVVRHASPSLRSQLADEAIKVLNQRFRRESENEFGSRDRQSDLATGIVGVVASLESEDGERVYRFSEQSSDQDSLLATYAGSALLCGRPQNAFTVGERFSGRRLDREIFTGMCLEGIRPSAKTKLMCLANPAVRCLELVKGGAVAPPGADKELAYLFAGEDGEDARFGDDTREVIYEQFFTALATALQGGDAVGSTKISILAESTWLAGAIRSLEELAQTISNRWLKLQSWVTLRWLYAAVDIKPAPGGNYSRQRRYIATRLAFRDICIDLCLIGKAISPSFSISEEDITSSERSRFWLDEIWLDAFTERRIPLHAPGASLTLVRRYSDFLNSNVTEFNQRTSTRIKLALFCTDHGQTDAARQQLEHACNSLLGYGWRKDLTAMEVLESILMLADKGVATAKNALLELAGHFEAITDYTDGDETDHVRSDYYDAICDHAPERLGACYANLIAHEDWRYVEDLTKHLISAAPQDVAVQQALFETFICPDEILGLMSPSSAGNAAAKAALNVVQRKVGSRDPAGKPAGTRRQPTDSSSTNFDEPAEAAPAPADFPPEQLAQFLTAVRRVRSFDLRRGLIASWLTHWKSQGSGVEALAALSKEAKSDRATLELEDGFQTAYEIAQELEGRTAAFPWLVRNHIARHGWSRWWTSSDEFNLRVEEFVKEYPDRWKAFIQETAGAPFRTQNEGNGIVIGLSRLVHFLLAVGQIDLATQYTHALVEVFKEELSEQPIITPAWAV